MAQENKQGIKIFIKNITCVKFLFDASHGNFSQKIMKNHLTVAIKICYNISIERDEVI